MGLLDMFTKEGKLKRNVRRMSDEDAQSEDRDAAARWLVEEGSPKAIMGLLTRFDMSLSQQMKDRTEKQLVFDLLCRLGPDAVREPLAAWIRRAKKYAWPVRLMVELEGEEATIRTVFELLEGDVGKATFEPQRRKELLIWLAERRHPDAAAKIAPFLKDFDEEVRYAAGEVLVNQDDERTRLPLAGVLADPNEESTRLKHRIARVFQQRGWSVADVELRAPLPDGFALRDGRVVGA